MKKITFVIFTAFILINCSKDDSINEDMSNFQLTSSTSKKGNSTQSEVTYEIIDEESESIGKLSIYHDETTIYMICKTNEDSSVTETDIFFGTFSTITRIKQEASTIIYNFKANTQQSETIYSVEKKDLTFDKNGCVYVATNFKFLEGDSKIIQSAHAVSQVLPGSEKLPYFLYCIN